MQWISERKNIKKGWCFVFPILFEWLLALVLGLWKRPTYNSWNYVSCYKNHDGGAFWWVSTCAWKEKRYKNIELNHIMMNMNMVNKAKQVLLHELINWFKTVKGNKKTIIHLCHHKSFMLILVHTLSLKPSNLSFFLYINSIHNFD